MSNKVIRNYLDSFLSNNEKSLINNILSYIECEVCEKLVDIECECEICVECGRKQEETFICNGKCQGDIICEDCDHEFECDGCGDTFCSACIVMNCVCGTWCCYCEGLAVCYEEDNYRTWH